MDKAQCVRELAQLSVLYVEDEKAIRDEVAHFLERRVGRLLTAADGEEGLATFVAQRPDIVLTDIQMPQLDGFALAGKVKELRRGTPVIFATVFENSGYLQRAIALGVDGYVVKPIDFEQLVQTLLRSVELLMQAREISTSRAQLAAYHDAAEEERRLVADLMARMMRPENLQDRQVRYWLRPAEIVGGDLVAVARGRNNRLYLMLADSTGHGLPAALNLLSINHIFYRMVSKNLPVSMIVEEMNWAVREQSPTERYVSALVASVDTRNRVLEVWNGGLPPALFVDRAGEVARSFPSDNFPLGVLDRTFAAETDIYQWSAPGDFFVHSDGLEDAEDEAGKAFGGERVLNTLKAAPPAERFDALRHAVEAHLGQRNVFDDISLMMIAGDLPAATH